MKSGPIPEVNIAHNTASRGYREVNWMTIPLRSAGPSTLRTTRYRRFSHGWGCYPSNAYDSTAARVKAFVEQGGGCRATFFNHRRSLTGDNRTVDKRAT